MLDNGSEALASHKEKADGVNAGLKSHFRRDDSISGSEVQLPVESETLT